MPSVLTKARFLLKDKRVRSKSCEDFVLAAHEGRTDDVLALLALGVPINVRDKAASSNKNGALTDGRTALYRAVRAGHLDVAKVLVANGADVRRRQSANATPLLVAAQEGHLDCVKFLMDNGAKGDLERQDKYGFTPLLAACLNGHVHVIEYLVAQGARLDRKDSHGCSAVMIAAESGQPASLRWLFKHGGAIDVNLVNENKATAIYIAAQRGSTESVQLLLDHGADPNVAYKTGCTPIGISAQNGHADCLSLFLKHDQVDSNASDTSMGKFTALHYASKHGRTKCVRILLEHGVSIDPNDYRQRSPLWHAIHNSHIETIELLLSYGAQPSPAPSAER